jgi:ubiquinone/menaquinone biosynthesis C-methylase UbiE
MRAWIYDLMFHNLSKDWYTFIFDAMPNDIRLLDVGVGTGSSLLSQINLIRNKSIQVQGIDINTKYLQACQTKIERLQATDCINVREQSVYDLSSDDLFDAVYFSASFMLLPSQREALQVIRGSLRENGYVCFTQTFEKKRARIMEVIKPLLYMVTTIHFGVVTYQQPFLEMLAEQGFEVIQNEILQDQGSREMRAIIARVKS